MTGADPGFQVSGGGGGALKKIASSGGRRENFWGISCEKFLRQKIIFFPILGGRRVRPPPWIRPCMAYLQNQFNTDSSTIVYHGYTNVV